MDERPLNRFCNQDDSYDLPEDLANVSAASCAVRTRYVDGRGEPQSIVSLFSFPVSEAKAKSGRLKTLAQAMVTVMGGVLLDVSIEFEEREAIVQTNSISSERLRGLGRLQLATVDGITATGAHVVRQQLLMDQLDEQPVPRKKSIAEIWEPTDFSGLDSLDTLHG